MSGKAFSEPICLKGLLQARDQSLHQNQILASCGTNHATAPRGPRLARQAWAPITRLHLADHGLLARLGHSEATVQADERPTGVRQKTHNP